MQRLLRKFETAKSLVPAPVITLAKPQERTKYGLIFFGSSAPAAREALASLAETGIQLDRMRIRAFPFPEAVSDFINAYDQVFLVEQNRDAQMRSLLVNECGIDPARFISILHYDGTPITARFIINAIAERIAVTAKEAAE
jgi:2-oxoglutarate ferredoxin oxidoreductase subunit alpha